MHAENSRMDVLYLSAGGHGWGPIDELVELTVRCFGATRIELLDAGEVSILRKAATFIPRRRGKGRVLLVIATNPAQLAYVARTRHWVPGYEAVAAWIIDSFWTDRISLFARHGHFDHFFITDRELVPEWSEATRTPTSWLPWGTDTMKFVSVPSVRSLDLLRLGRQPDAWQSDSDIQKRAGLLGLRFGGRPRMGTTGAENQEIVREALRSTKYLLAFHNLVSPASYTHPSRTYLTGRWMDALGAGTIVAGAAPKAASYTLWPGATVEIDHDDLDRGLNTLAGEIEHWTPSLSMWTQRQARRHLDWRYRLDEIASTLQVAAPSLSRELADLRSRVA